MQRTNGTARYIAGNSSAVLSGGSQAQGTSVNTARLPSVGVGGGNLPNISHAAFSLDILLQRQLGSINILNMEVILAVHRTRVLLLDGGGNQGQYRMSSGVGSDASFRSFQGQTNGRPAMSQSPMTHPSYHSLNQNTQRLTPSVSPSGYPIINFGASTAPGDVQSREQTATMNGMLSESSPLQTQQISAHAYAITGQWRENESIYPEPPHISPYGLEPVYLDPFGEIPRMENLGVANDSGINETLANTPHLSMHEHTHSVALTNGASAGHTRLHNQEQYMEGNDDCSMEDSAGYH